MSSPGSVLDLAPQTVFPCLVMLFLALMAIMLAPAALGAPPDPEPWFLPYTPDDHTLLLAHFDGEGNTDRAEGSCAGDVTFDGDLKRCEGRFGGGSAFGGGKARLMLPAPDALAFGQAQPFTLEAWVRPETRDTVSVFSVRTRFYAKISVATNTVTFGYRAASFPIGWYTIAGVPLQLGRWQHLAIVHDETRRVWVYLNGALAGETTHPDEGDFERTGGIFVGSHDGWSVWYRGAVDEVRVSDVVRTYQPLFAHQWFLAGERPTLALPPEGLPAAVAGLRLTGPGRDGRPLAADVPRAAAATGLCEAEKLPERLSPFALSMLDADGKTIASVEVLLGYAGERADALRRRADAVLAAMRDAAATAPVHARAAAAYVEGALALAEKRQFEQAEEMTVAAEALTGMVATGEAAYRERLRKAVRARQADPGVVRLSMSWRGDERAAEAQPWAERLGANELIATSEATREGVGLWKERGFATVMLGSLPMRPGDWLKEHPEDSQYGYWVTPPVQAEGDSVVIPLRPTRWGHEHITMRFDPRQHWLVLDQTAGRVVPPDQWAVDAEGQSVTVKAATAGHAYVVYFMEEQAVGDPLRESFVEGSLQVLRERLEPLKGVLDTYWYDDLGYAYPGPTPQGPWDWESYTFAAHPANQQAFEKDTGIKVDPRWLVLAPRTIDVVPPPEYLRWSEWVQARMKPWLRRATDVPHSLGMRAWLYWGDCHVGMEPYLSSLTAGKLDELDKPAADPVTARALADLCDIAPGLVRRFRVDWLFTDRVSQPREAERMRAKWAAARRGLLLCPVRGIYWMTFDLVPQVAEAAVREGLTETLADINDEFRLVAEQLGDRRAWRHDLHVTVLHSWGKQYSWRPWGSPVLRPLASLPVEVSFARLADVERDGLPADTDVLLVYGLPGTAWSGGRWWESGKVAQAVGELVRGGGGVLALQAPSELPGDQPRWALSDLLGVAATGAAALAAAGLDESAAADRGLEVPAAKAHFVLGDAPAAVPGLRETVRAVVSAPDATVLADALDAQGGRSPGLVVRDVGKGRAVYLCGYSGEQAFGELFRRALFWAAGREDAEGWLKAEGPQAEAYAYPDRDLLALCSEDPAARGARLFCAPAVFGMSADDRVLLRDVVTGEQVFEGQAAGLAAGADIKLFGRCVRLLRVEKPG